MRQGYFRRPHRPAVIGPCGVELARVVLRMRLKCVGSLPLEVAVMLVGPGVKLAKA
jgi:hypothetical protein